MKESGKVREEAERAERESKEEEQRRLEEKQRGERKRERRRARRVMLLAAQLKEALERQGKVVLETPLKSAQLKEAVERQGEGRQGAMGQGREEGVRERWAKASDGWEKGEETSEGESETSEELKAVKMEYGGDKVGKVEGGGNGLGAGGSLDVEEFESGGFGAGSAAAGGAIEGLKEVRDLPKLMSWLGGVSQGEGGEVGRAEVDPASDDVSLGSAEVSQVLYELAIAEESEKALALLRWMEERREREWEGMSTDQRRRKIVEEERGERSEKPRKRDATGGRGIERRTASGGEDGVPEEIQGGVVIGAVLGAPENTPRGGAVRANVECVRARDAGAAGEGAEGAEWAAGAAGAAVKAAAGTVGENPSSPHPHSPPCLLPTHWRSGWHRQGLVSTCCVFQNEERAGPGAEHWAEQGAEQGAGQGAEQRAKQGNWKGGGTEWGKGGGKGGSERGFKWATKGRGRQGKGGLLGVMPPGDEGVLEGGRAGGPGGMQRAGGGDVCDGRQTETHSLTFSLLIRAMLQEGELKRAPRVLRERMPRRNLVPRLEDVHAVMKALLGQGKEAGVAEAMRIMNEILEVKGEGWRRESTLQMVKPSEVSWGRTGRQGGEAGVAEAMRLMDEILGLTREGWRRESTLQMVKPSELTFRMLILGLCRERNPSKAVFYLTCMMDAGLMPDRQLFRACMLTLSALGITRDALEFFELMRGTRATWALIDADLCVLCRSRITRDALELFELMRGTRATRALIDADMCTLLLAALGKRGLGLEMKRVASLMRKVGKWGLLVAGSGGVVKVGEGHTGADRRGHVHAAAGGAGQARAGARDETSGITHAQGGKVGALGSRKWRSGKRWERVTLVLIMGKVGESAIGSGEGGVLVVGEGHTGADRRGHVRAAAGGAGQARAGARDETCGLPYAEGGVLVVRKEGGVLVMAIPHSGESYAQLIMGYARAGMWSEVDALVAEMEEQTSRSNANVNLGADIAAEPASVSAAAVEELGIGVGATVRDSMAVCNALMMAYGRAGRMEQMEMVVNRLRVLSPDGTLRLESYNTLLEVYARRCARNPRRRGRNKSRSRAGTVATDTAADSNSDAATPSPSQGEARKPQAQSEGEEEEVADKEGDGYVEGDLEDEQEGGEWGGEEAEEEEEEEAVRARQAAAMADVARVVMEVEGAGLRLSMRSYAAVMQALGLRLSMRSCAAVMQALGLAGHFDQVKGLVAAARAQGLSFSPPVYRMLIDMLGLIGGEEREMKGCLVAAARAQGLSFSPPVYRMLIDVLGRGGRLGEALLVLEELKRVHPGHGNLSAYNTLLLVSGVLVIKVCTRYKVHRDGSSENCLGGGGETLLVLEELKRVHPGHGNLSAYNTLLLALQDAHPEHIFAVLALMASQRVLVIPLPSPPFPCPSTFPTLSHARHPLPIPLRPYKTPIQSTCSQHYKTPIQSTCCSASTHGINTSAGYPSPHPSPRPSPLPHATSPSFPTHPHVSQALQDAHPEHMFAVLALMASQRVLVTPTPFPTLPLPPLPMLPCAPQALQDAHPEHMFAVLALMASQRVLPNRNSLGAMLAACEAANSPRGAARVYLSVVDTWRDGVGREGSGGGGGEDGEEWEGEEGEGGGVVDAILKAVERFGEGKQQQQKEGQQQKLKQQQLLQQQQGQQQEEKQQQRQKQEEKQQQKEGQQKQKEGQQKQKQKKGQKQQKDEEEEEREGQQGPRSPSMEMAERVVRLCREGLLAGQAVRVLEGLLANGIVPSVKCYSDVIHCLGEEFSAVTGTATDAALLLEEQEQQQQQQPFSFRWSSDIHSSDKNDESDQSGKSDQHADKALPYTYSSDLLLLSSLLSIQIDRGNFDEAMHTAQFIVNERLDEYLYNEYMEEDNRNRDIRGGDSYRGIQGGSVLRRADPAFFPLVIGFFRLARLIPVVEGRTKQNLSVLLLLLMSQAVRCGAPPLVSGFLVSAWAKANQEEGESPVGDTSSSSSARRPRADVDSDTADVDPSTADVADKKTSSKEDADLDELVDDIDSNADPAFMHVPPRILAEFRSFLTLPPCPIESSRAVANAIIDTAYSLHLTQAAVDLFYAANEARMFPDLFRLERDSLVLSLRLVSPAGAENFKGSLSLLWLSTCENVDPV
ncbi:unnamed protein product [Closterium sp. Naga37s-1]|nr:unnamed protein product [Closterium sp. Naga37s-1]